MGGEGGTRAEEGKVRHCTGRKMDRRRKTTMGARRRGGEERKGTKMSKLL